MKKIREGLLTEKKIIEKQGTNKTQKYKSSERGKSKGEKGKI